MIRGHFNVTPRYSRDLGEGSLDGVDSMRDSDDRRVTGKGTIHGASVGPTGAVEGIGELATQL